MKKAIGRSPVPAWELLATALFLHGSQPATTLARRGENLAQALAIEQATAPPSAYRRQLSPLEQAVRRNDATAVKLLLDAGANVNAKNDAGEPILFDAETLEMITLLIESGADVNAVDRLKTTPLMRAAARGRSEMIQWLLQKGANATLRDFQGRTALSTLGRVCFSTEAAEALIAHSKADLGQALNYAAGVPCMDLARFFVERGADVNWQNSYRVTSLMAASIWGHTEAVELLLANGADATLKNKGGRTARDEASRPEIRRMLQEAERRQRAERRRAR